MTDSNTTPIEIDPTDFAEEYKALVANYEDICKYCAKLETGVATSNTPKNVYDQQKRAMGTYLDQMRLRAEYEGIDIYIA